LVSRSPSGRRSGQASLIAGITLFLLFVVIIASMVAIENTHTFALREQEAAEQTLILEQKEHLCVTYIPQTSQLVVTNTGPIPSTVTGIIEYPQASNGGQSTITVVGENTIIQPGFSYQFNVASGSAEYIVVTAFGNTFENVTSC